LVEVSTSRCFAIHGVSAMETSANRVADVFIAPFKGIAYVVNAWQQLPLWLGLSLIVAVCLILALSSFTEAGPFKVATLARRFSWIGIPIATFIVWWSWIALLFWRDYTLVTSAVLFSSFVLIVLLYWCAFLYYVLLRDHMHRYIARNAYRRIRFRLRWESIARASGMAHERDVRPHRWFLGGTTLQRQRALIVQWTPILWHGRRGASPSITHYLIRPARGIAANQWGDPKVGDSKTDLEQALAIAANAESAIITKATDKRNWWTLTLFWNDIEDYRDVVQ